MFQDNAAIPGHEHIRAEYVARDPGCLQGRAAERTALAQAALPRAELIPSLYPSILNPQHDSLNFAALVDSSRVPIILNINCRH